MRWLRLAGYSPAEIHVSVGPGSADVGLVCFCHINRLALLELQSMTHTL